MLTRCNFKKWGCWTITLLPNKFLSVNSNSKMQILLARPNQVQRTQYDLHAITFIPDYQPQKSNHNRIPLGSLKLFIRNNRSSLESYHVIIAINCSNIVSFSTGHFFNVFKPCENLKKILSLKFSIDILHIFYHVTINHMNV